MQSLQETGVDVSIRVSYRKEPGEDLHFSYCPTTDELTDATRFTV